MNTMKTFLLMGILTVMLVFIGRLLGGEGGMIMAFVLAAVMNFGTYWFSDKMVLRMYKAQEVTQADAPELYQMVQELSDRAGLPDAEGVRDPERPAQRLRDRTESSARGRCCDAGHHADALARRTAGRDRA